MQRLAKSAVVHVAFAFLAMGGWTLYANLGHGLAQAWVPALVQGAISGAVTLALKGVLDRLVGRFAGAAAYVLPPLMTASTVIALLIVVHRLVGTPEIARTIAVPWSVSTLYAILYTAALVRERKRETA